jgi:hypothetical protein
MINQSILNNDKRIILSLESPLDSGVAVSVYNPSSTKIINNQVTVYDSVNAEYYFDLDASILSSIGTYTIEWNYITATNSTVQDRDQLDVLHDASIRYCYCGDVRRKLFDILLPSTFDLGEYTRRASIEIERALQGLYVLPLVPDSAHANYQQDVDSLRELCSDIAAGYVSEDISISRNQQGYNAKKAAAFAELKRYVELKKVFASVPQDSIKTDLTYKSAKPQVSGFKYTDVGGASLRDPFNEVYDNFSPVGKDV